MFETFHAGRDLAALELHDPVKGTDFDIAVTDDEDPGLLSRNNFESFGTQRGSEGPAPIRSGPCGTNRLGGIGQLHALTGERLPLRWRRGRIRLVRIGAVGRFEPVGNIGSAVRP